MNDQSDQTIKPGLERMYKMLDRLQPETIGINFIHISGTNGKGSLGSYCMSVLSAAGFKVGWFSSPHLQRKSESIRILDGVYGLESYLSNEQYGEISIDDFEILMKRIQSNVINFKKPDKNIPSEFEYLTMIALLHFSINKCEWVVWETGMGGKTDATNILERPISCMITAIGLDHVQWLGNRYEKIADEKAGIIKQSSPVYLYNPEDVISNPEDAARVIKTISQKCKIEKSDLHIISAENLIIDSYNFEGQVFHFKNDPVKRTYKTRQLGVYQPQLAAMAVKLFEDLKIDEKYIREGLSKAIWPGRMEICCKESDKDKFILLDGAHNPLGCEALQKSLTHLMPGGNIAFLVGVLSDKDADNMFDEVINSINYRTKAIVCTRPASPRALPANDLAEKIADMTGRRPLRLQLDSNQLYNTSDHVFYSDDAVEATNFALELYAKENLSLCVFGSLYLVGIVRPLLLMPK